MRTEALILEKYFLNNINCYSPRSRDELIEEAFAKKSILVAVNAEKLIKADKELVDIINRNVGYPDGVGAVLALKQQGASSPVKIPGCELWLDIIKKYSASKSFYFIGASECTINKTRLKLEDEYPLINIVGLRNGFISDESEKELLFEDIKTKKPDIVFVAMGTPRQEKLMEELISIHPALYQGLGGSFDVYVDNVHRAPKFWLKYNIEWLYRLIQEPTRWRRQVSLINFVLFLLKGSFKKSSKMQNV